MTTPILPTFIVKDILSYLDRDIYQDKKGDWYFRFTPGLHDDALGWMFQSMFTIVNRISPHSPRGMEDWDWRIDILGDKKDSVCRFDEIRQYKRYIDRPRCSVTVSYSTGNHIDKADYSITFRFFRQFHLPLVTHKIEENIYYF